MRNNNQFLCSYVCLSFDWLSPSILEPPTWPTLCPWSLVRLYNLSSCLCNKVICYCWFSNYVFSFMFFTLIVLVLMNCRFHFSDLTMNHASYKPENFAIRLVQSHKNYIIVFAPYKFACFHFWQTFKALVS